LLFLSVGLAASASTYNAALDQTAVLSSQSGEKVASLANDGSFVTTDPDCAATDSHLSLPYSPWWAVDLGDTFTVVEVKLTGSSVWSMYRYRVFQKTVPLFYFYDNFHKCTPILTFFSLLEP